MKKKIRRRRHISIINMNKINGNDYDKNMQSDIALCYERKKKKKNTIGNWRVSLGSGVSVLPALPFSVPRVRPTLYWTWNAIDRASDTSWVIQLEHGVAICMLSCKYLYIYIYIYVYTIIHRWLPVSTVRPLFTPVGPREKLDRDLEDRTRSY